MEWLLHVVAYASGIATIPVLGRLFGGAVTEVRNHWTSVVAARRVISRQLDPLLKSADELHGKLRSLAEEDFLDFRDLPETGMSLVQLVDLCSTLYLFAQF